MATFKVAVVTGGGGGIGRAFSERLAKEGARVAVVDLDPDTAAATAKEVGGIALACDVGDEAALTATIDEVESALGPIDLFVNKSILASVSIAISKHQVEKSIDYHLSIKRPTEFILKIL